MKRLLSIDEVKEIALANIISSLLVKGNEFSVAKSAIRNSHLMRVYSRPEVTF